jgi:hypothetical protein
VAKDTAAQEIVPFVDTQPTINENETGRLALKQEEIVD